MGDNSELIALAKQLQEAEKNKQSLKGLTNDEIKLTLEEAYQIQLINIDAKLEAGNTIVGKKIGLTSKVMQELLGVGQPDYGHLLDNMVVENGSEVAIDSLLQPRVEGEIAFILKDDLIGPNITSTDVLLATDYVVPAIEVIDSRIKDWKINIYDTIADNASSGLFVLGGQPHKVNEVDLETIGLVLYKNGKVINSGVGAAVLGHPANSVAWLANKLHELNIPLQAGEVILSGALSGAVDVQAGDHIKVRLAQIGDVDIHFTDK